MLKKKIALSVAIALMAMTGVVNAEVMIIDNSSAEGFSVTSDWWQASSETSVNGNFSYNQNDGTATYTPSGVASFTSGVYDLYVSWTAATGHNNAVYTVNYAGGSAGFTIAQNKNAAQGAVGSTAAVESCGSGYYYLGTYTLDASSTVVMSHDGLNLIADALMLRQAADGRYIDSQSASVKVSNTANWSVAPGASPCGNYSYDVSNDVSSASPVLWDLGASSGTYNLQISWGAYPSHISEAFYLVDINGNGVQDAEDTLVTINQQLLADQITTVTAGTWSGYYDMGSFELTADSQIVLWTNLEGPITMGSTIVTAAIPEPATMVLLAVGGIAAIIKRRK